MFPKKLLHTMIWTLVAAWGLGAGWTLAAAIRTGGSFAITAEVYDGGGDLSHKGGFVNGGGLGGVGEASTSGLIGLIGGYAAQIPELPPPEPPPPTAAVLLAFDARCLGGGEVTLRWEIGVEFDLLGFQIQRQGRSGEWVTINAGIFPAGGGGGSNRYTFLDSDAPDASQTRYRLLAVNLSGQSSFLSETVGRPALQAGIGLTPAGLLISVRGIGMGRVVVETATDAILGPWVPTAELNLDADGNSLLPATVDPEGPARFYRLRQE